MPIRQSEDVFLPSSCQSVSQEFLGNQTDENSINKSIEEISLTLRQFTEVTSVNVIVEGEISWKKA